MSLARFARDRVIAAAGIALVTALAWGYLASMPMPEHATLLGAWSASLAMWQVVMAPMMLPTAAPMLTTFAAVSRRRCSVLRTGALAIAAFAGGLLRAAGVGASVL